MYQTRQSVSFLCCRRRPVYLFSSMSLFIVFFYPHLYLFPNAEWTRVPKPHSFMPNRILARPNKGTHGEGTQVPHLSDLSSCPSLFLTVISFLATVSPSSSAAYYICYLALNLRTFHFKELTSVQTSATKRLSTGTKAIGKCRTESVDTKE